MSKHTHTHKCLNTHTHKRASTHTHTTYLSVCLWGVGIARCSVGVPLDLSRGSFGASECSSIQELPGCRACEQEKGNNRQPMRTHSIPAHRKQQSTNEKRTFHSITVTHTLYPNHITSRSEDRNILEHWQKCVQASPPILLPIVLLDNALAANQTGLLMSG